MEKSANQLWRESNTSLSFKDWIQREKDKGVQIKNKLLEDVVGSVKETKQDDTELNKRFDFGARWHPLTRSNNRKRVWDSCCSWDQKCN